ncbi:MAG: 5-(carboxyamino)imidazole ribonucleotide synthase [Verrucomicrobiota bacterium]
MRPRVYLPGSKIGVMGGGQLGRMFAIAARRMGYRIHTFAPDEDTPAGQLADVEFHADYADETAVRNFAKHVDVLTFEFENIPLQTIRWAGEHCEVRPGGDVLHISQHRLREKDFLSAAGFPLPVYHPVASAADLEAGMETTGLPCILKTASFGYDGKGQRKIVTRDDAQGIDLNGEAFVLEAFVGFSKEISVVVARGADGQMETFPVCENIHRDHILDLTIVPARMNSRDANAAQNLARNLAEEIGLVGVLAVEMFLMPDGAILVNELAPRPHNSGHFSFDACVTSQFEQQLRAVCGLPLGSTDLFRPSAMANLLGDLWLNGEPNWHAASTFRDVKIHLYGKSKPKPKRKMGHLLAFGIDAESAASRVREARLSLSSEFSCPKETGMLS